MRFFQGGTRKHPNRTQTSDPEQNTTYAYLKTYPVLVLSDHARSYSLNKLIPQV